MASEGRYRPAAPSDGFGNISFPLTELDLDAEAREYAERWWKEEGEGVFVVGSCDYRTPPATIFAIEAARLMCGGIDGNEPALRLLKMAVQQLERVSHAT
jgi:hypothetical protein